MPKGFKRIILLAVLLGLALVVFFVFFPSILHETVAVIFLDVELVKKAETTDASFQSALEKIEKLHHPRSSRLQKRERVVLTTKEINSYITGRMAEHRAGKLPRTIRAALENVQMEFGDGRFTIRGNVDLKLLARYSEKEYDLKIPEAYKKRKTTFLVSGTLRAEHGTGRVTIETKQLGRIPGMVTNDIEQVEKIARRAVQSTLVEDFFQAKLISESEMTFRLTEGLESITLTEGAVEFVVVPVAGARSPRESLRRRIRRP